MKPACERCQAELAPTADAYICSWECTFCADCATAMGRNCPNCKGELVPRPRRRDSGPAPQASTSVG